MNLYHWAARWGVSMAAIRDLEQVLGCAPEGQLLGNPDEHGEGGAQARIRLAAAETPGLYLFRNNVGALKDERGRLVRFGLANDSKAMNDTIKSGDLIGLRRVEITPAMVGSCIGQFVSVECKAPGWSFTGTPREVAQRRWADLVLAMGGHAVFASGPEGVGL